MKEKIIVFCLISVVFIVDYYTFLLIKYLINLIFAS